MSRVSRFQARRRPATAPSKSCSRRPSKAAKSPLGLSRLGILYAATHMTFQSSTMLPGVIYSLNYLKDEVAMESAQLSSFNSAASGQWQKVQVYNFNGQTTTGEASS